MIYSIAIFVLSLPIAFLSYAVSLEVGLWCLLYIVVVLGLILARVAPNLPAHYGVASLLLWPYLYCLYWMMNPLYLGGLLVVAPLLALLKILTIQQKYKQDTKLSSATTALASDAETWRTLQVLKAAPLLLSPFFLAGCFCLYTSLS